MAKMYGYSGKITGRKGDTVFTVRHGEQIIRQYNPIVLNPSTTKQVDRRATFKLLSQLGAVLSKVIAIPRLRNASRRNRFVSANYNLATATAGKAEINLSALQLTKSNIPMADFRVTRSNTSPTMRIELDNDENYDIVVYIALEKNALGEMRVYDTQIVERSTPQPTTFRTYMPYSSTDIVFYAYGITFKDKATRTAFGDITSPNAQAIAQLIATATISTANSIITKTKGLYLAEGETEGDTAEVEPTPAFAVILSSDPTGASLSGAGQYAAGTLVSIQAEPTFSHLIFDGWYENNELISSQGLYVFTINEPRTFVARYN